MNKFIKSVGELRDKIKQTADYMGEDKEVEDDYKYEDLCRSMDYLRQDLNNLWGQFYNYVDTHQQGHLPKIEGATQMQRILEILEMSGSYEVAKKVIYASNGKPEKIILEVKAK